MNWLGPSVQFRGRKKNLLHFAKTPDSFLLLTSRPDGVGKDGGGGNDDDNVKKKKKDLTLTSM